MSRPDPLKLLRRPDKWYLGGANRLVWTPPFPAWLDSPGFWDAAHYYNFALEPLFTWTLLDRNGEEIPLQPIDRTWDPSKLVSRLRPRRIAARVAVTETRLCLPNDVLCSVVTIRNRSAKSLRLHLVAWTLQPQIGELTAQKGVWGFLRQLSNGGPSPFGVHCAFGLGKPPSSVSSCGTESAVGQPRWDLTPFTEKFRNGKLTEGGRPGAMTFLALHRTINLRPSTSETLAICFAAAPSRAEAASNLASAAKQDDPVGLSTQNWLDYFATVPSFLSSDDALMRYYWYRWYGLRLMTIDPQEGNLRRPVVCEGPGYFRAPISYSAPCHMIENRWRHDPVLAQGSLLTFIDNQREDGGFRGYLDVDRYRQEMFYHARWGKAVRELHAHHPDRRFLEEIYPGLRKYAAYFDQKRDREGSGLYDITNHYETGQEYMHRYLAASPDADREHWGEIFRLKGVDVTVYLYELKTTLAWMAGILGRTEDEAEFRAGAKKIGQAVRATMWDPAEEMFFDVDPSSGKRTGVKALTCFYPYMTDIVGAEHLAGLKRHLFNPKEFWTPFPAPSSSADDPYFSADAEWKGERKNCPWNGRVWPMTNSHIADALAYCAERFDDPSLRRRSTEFIGKFIRMMFFDPKRPNAFEHYNPVTGQASVYRGVDDYQHSWVNDLILTVIAGVRVEEGAVTFRPPGGAAFELRDLLIAGRVFRVVSDRRGLRVWVDGALVRAEAGAPVRVPV